MSAGTEEKYEDKTRLILCTVVTVMSVVIYIILMIGNLQFKEIMPLIIVKKRYPRIVLLESMLSIIVMFFYIPLYAAVIFQLQILSKYQKYITFAAFSFYPICHGIILCEVCRLWLICYDLNYSYSSKNSVWKSQINQKFDSKNWWLKNRNSFGNYEYITKRGFIYAMCTGVTSMILYQMYGLQQWNHIIDLSLYTIPLIFLLYAYYAKCPKITKDNFFFQLEFKSSICIYLTTLVIYILAAITFIFDPFIAKTIILIDAVFAFSFVSILSTLWIPRKILSKIEWLDELHNGPYHKNDAKHNANNIGNRTNNLLNIFSDNQGLELFALHLNHEFSLECLLAFIEMMQFKQYFNEIYFKKRRDYVKLEGHRIRFAFTETSLKSAIVYETCRFSIPQHDDSTPNTDGTMEKNTNNHKNMEKKSNKNRVTKGGLVIKKFKLIAYLLYKKYIREYSELEINLSSMYRLEYNTLMSDKKEWIDSVELSPKDLLVLFDDVCLEMFKLMDHSFGRFKRSKEYKKFTESVETV